MRSRLCFLYPLIPGLFMQGCPKSGNAGKPECRNAGNQDPEILKPGMTFREGKRAK